MSDRRSLALCGVVVPVAIIIGSMLMFRRADEDRAAVAAVPAR